MTTPLAHDDNTTSRMQCWCCGEEKLEEDLFRLGQHPEVAICTTCARWLHRRATQREDTLHPTIAARLRAVVQAARTTVIDKGWHHHRILGTLLHRIDRHLP